jgi:nucleotide-binding universal stress UspA family protein
MIPIAIIRPGATTQRADTPRIVAAVDGSETAQKALRWAVREARLRSAALDVVHAWQLPFMGYASLAELSIDPTQYEDESRRTLGDAIAAEDTAGVQVNPIPLCKDPVSGILEFAVGASLLVAGSRGLSTFKRAVFGSVATKLSHHASCPLVIVPSDA